MNARLNSLRRHEDEARHTARAARRDDEIVLTDVRADISDGAGIVHISRYNNGFRMSAEAILALTEFGDTSILSALIDEEIVWISTKEAKTHSIKEVFLRAVYENGSKKMDCLIND